MYLISFHWAISIDKCKFMDFKLSHGFKIPFVSILSVHFEINEQTNIILTKHNVSIRKDFHLEISTSYKLSSNAYKHILENI